MSMPQEYQIMGSDGHMDRFVGNRPAKGYCFDLVKRCLGLTHIIIYNCYHSKGMNMKNNLAKQIASYYIKKSDSVKENDLTNLKLQKILYYSQAEFYKKNNKALFSEDIEAWDLGPVVRGVYDWLKSCGSYPVSSFDVKLDLNGISEEVAKFLDEIWEKYSKYSAFYLVNKSHNPSEPWYEIYHDPSRNIIDVSLLGSVKLQHEWK